MKSWVAVQVRQSLNRQFSKKRVNFLFAIRHSDIYGEQAMPSIVLTIRSLGYERVHLPLCKVLDTTFYITGDKLY